MLSQLKFWMRVLVVLLGIGSILPSSPLLADESTKDDAKGRKESTVQVARMVIRGEIPERAGSPGLFGDLRPNLRQLVSRLDQAAQDDDIKSVVLRPQSPMIGRGKLAELRAAIGRVQAAGKKVYAQLEMATARDYLLASACDEIVMPESGVLMVTGLHAEVAFFKDTLEYLGIEADMMQVGSYKGAAEPFTRDSMSDEYRSQYEALIDDLYHHLIETIASDRGLQVDHVRRLIDQGLFTAADAKTSGLIDHVIYDGEFRERLRTEATVDRLVMVDDYGTHKNELDLSGPFAFMNLMQLFTGSTEKATGNRKKIAIVYAAGPIIGGESKSGILGEQSVGSDTIVKAIRTAEKDEQVVATVLRVDSPGGSAIASDQIWRAIVDAEKPVVASMGDVAASGGYYISMGCDKILAEPETITGSIGVVGGKLALDGLYGKIGMNVETISRGKNSGMFSSLAKFTDSERGAWTKMMTETYLQFVTKAALGRDMTVDKMESLAGGRLWTGRQAQKNGLVDQLGSLDDAVRTAKKLAGLDEGEKTDLLILPKPKSFLDQLMEDPILGAQVKQSIDVLDPRMGARLNDVELVRQLFKEPSVLLIPCRISVR